MTAVTSGNHTTFVYSPRSASFRPSPAGLDAFPVGPSPHPSRLTTANICQLKILDHLRGAFLPLSFYVPAQQSFLELCLWPFAGVCSTESSPVTFHFGFSLQRHHQHLDIDPSPTFIYTCFFSSDFSTLIRACSSDYRHLFLLSVRRRSFAEPPIRPLLTAAAPTSSSSFTFYITLL